MKANQFVNSFLGLAIAATRYYWKSCLTQNPCNDSLSYWPSFFI